MTCKDCIHNEVGCEYTPTDLDKDIWEYCANGKSEDIPNIEERCEDFKNKANFVDYNT